VRSQSKEDHYDCDESYDAGLAREGQGIQSSSGPQANGREAAAYEYGRIFAELKRQGRVIQQVDIQIAAIARVLGNCAVVSGDNDLTAVPGLTVENWAG
jgi:hypothetical protein